MPVEISNSQLYLVYVLTVQEENIFCKATQGTVP